MYKMTKPLKVHKAWHLLLIIASILVLTSILFNKTLVEKWFSPDGHITEAGSDYLNLLRIGVLILAGFFILLWMLRKVIWRDWRETVSRWKSSPIELSTSAIIPALHPTFLKKTFWSMFFLWCLLLVLILVPGGLDSLGAQLTDEKGLFENLTAFLYLVAGLLAVRLAIPLLKRNSPHGMLRWWLLGLSIGCIFVAGEEINWGGLYFHYEAGDYIRQSNYQHEISLHNIELPFFGSYWGNDLLKILATLGGILLPFLLWLNISFRRMMWAVDFPLPTWLSQALFFIAAIIPGDKAFEYQRINMPSELREVTISFGIAIWLWCFLNKRLAK